MGPSDLTLVCEEQEFKIHKAVVCPQSPVLAAAANGHFQEAETGIINIQGFDRFTVRRMVEFLYTGNYDQQPTEQSKVASATPSAFAVSTVPSVVAAVASSTPSGVGDVVENPNEETGTAPTWEQRDSEMQDSALTLTDEPSDQAFATKTLPHVHVNAIADYYNIPDLKELAKLRIQEVHQRDDWDAKDFIHAAEKAIQLTGDESLHSMMARLVARHMKKLMDYDELGDLVGDFVLDVLRYHAVVVEADIRAQRRDLAQQNDDLEIRCLAAEGKAHRLVENVNRMIDNTNQREYCRNTACSEPFGCYIEQVGSNEQPGYLIRCAWCLCRHT